MKHMSANWGHVLCRSEVRRTEQGLYIDKNAELGIRGKARSEAAITDNRHVMC